MGDILDVEVLLSNFDGRDREFLGYASMEAEEKAYREGEQSTHVEFNNED